MVCFPLTASTRLYRDFQCNSCDYSKEFDPVTCVNKIKRDDASHVRSVVMDHRSQPNEEKLGRRKQYCQFVQQATGIIQRGQTLAALRSSDVTSLLYKSSVYTGRLILSINAQPHNKFRYPCSRICIQSICCVQ
jgi:hypothetical protein